MIKDKLSIRGDLKIVKTNTETGAEENYEFKNLVVDSGIELVLRSISNASRPAAIESMAVGTGTTGQISTDTALETELTRVATDFQNLSSANNTMEYQATFAPGVATGALTEAGLFNNATQGGGPEDTMLCRTVFPVINKQAADQLIISWVISLSVV